MNATFANSGTEVPRYRICPDKSPFITQQRIPGMCSGNPLFFCRYTLLRPHAAVFARADLKMTLDDTQVRFREKAQPGLGDDLITL